MKAHDLRHAALLALFTISFAIPAANGGDIEVSVTTAGTPPPTDIRLRLNGTVVAKGVKNGALNADDLTPGVRMIWHPGKAALRVGETTGSPVIESNIGLYSLGIGLNPTAIGASSIVIGDTATAYSSNDIALGYHATTNWGVAIGNQSSAYYNGYSFGSGASSMMGGIALGYTASATSTSAALGSNVTASNYSTAIGYQNNANNYSTALGTFTTATGRYSTSLGYSTSAQAYSSTVLGQYNATETSNANGWQPADFLFVIGNGTGYFADPPAVRNRNAFVVRKNGDVTMTGKITMPKQGDISMGEFGP